MTPEQFTYWLQGFMEISDAKVIGEKETQVIKDHLKLVFDKQTPDRSSQLLKVEQPLLSDELLKKIEEDGAGRVGPRTALIC